MLMAVRLGAMCVLSIVAELILYDKWFLIGRRADVPDISYQNRLYDCFIVELFEEIERGDIQVNYCKI